MQGCSVRVIKTSQLYPMKLIAWSTCIQLHDFSGNIQKCSEALVDLVWYSAHVVHSRHKSINQTAATLCIGIDLTGNYVWPCSVNQKTNPWHLDLCCILTIQRLRARSVQWVKETQVAHTNAWNSKPAFPC